MSPIAFITSQHQQRRTLVGALASDPVVPEARPRSTRRFAREIRDRAPQTAQAQAARCTRPTPASVC